MFSQLELRQAFNSNSIRSNRPWIGSLNEFETLRSQDRAVMSLTEGSLCWPIDDASRNMERVELICIDAAQVVDRFVFTSFPAVIGRSPDADAVIDNHWVSRHHCSIERDVGGFVARDLNSHNGTYLNERPMAESRISSGDHLTIGMITFLVLLHSDDMPSTVVFVPRGGQSE